ncbi:SAM-dependent methyltransferase [Allosaccharopolyspora coralli]|uniref:SAM-dependent methyltransferase n=1 Tax=Allosaccharopolyspora coralli TaxID=2665642 RepID=A0A5Q3Q555_9PSEU|nr:SAM-dependent methyltransferase [Allosaccharopolyspora coralli]QGK68960.1 SAM-dependent methyltransferase [Allosaccharopolyspora coralli]
MSAFSAEWLSLREDADAAARAVELLEPLREHLGRGSIVVRDLGSGTGGMARWLAGRLSGPQHWILHDHDPELLAATTVPDTAADGAAVTVETSLVEVSDLGDLHGTSLLTASALLDLLTANEVDALAESCADARCPALLSLSVVGRVVLEPVDPLDAEVAEAFDAHQRRRTDSRQLLGPDAVSVATDSFAREGLEVRTAPSVWRLDRSAQKLTEQWLRGWVDAASEQRPALDLDAYLRRRLDDLAAGALRVEVHHADLLALPSR